MIYSLFSKSGEKSRPPEKYRTSETVNAWNNEDLYTLDQTDWTLTAETRAGPHPISSSSIACLGWQNSSLKVQ